MSGPVRTARLVLRRWHPDDREPFAALNADAAVVEHLPGPLTRAQSDALVDRIEAHFDEHGYGLWAVQHAGRLIGFTGLQWMTWPAPFTPALEVGWRLARSAWGQGFAHEAATAALGIGLRHVESVVSVTAVSNERSERVMRRLGMRREGEFDHPLLEAGHRLRRHVLYRAERGVWSPE